MNEIDEKLWNYIDGSCSAEENRAISLLIETDLAYQAKYTELLKLNAEFTSMELEEPSMAFTYHVMESIRAEIAQKPLKASVNKWIIWAIGGFFVLSIVAMLGVLLGGIHWSAIDAGNSTPSFATKIPDVKSYFSTPVINIFIFFDVILGLYLLDGFFRKKLINHQAIN